MRWSRSNTATVTDKTESQTLEPAGGERSDRALSASVTNAESTLSIPSGHEGEVDGDVKTLNTTTHMEQQAEYDERTSPIPRSAQSTGTKRTRADRDSRDKTESTYDVSGGDDFVASSLADCSFDDGEDSEDSGSYDTHDFDPGSGSDHALPDPPIPSTDEGTGKSSTTSNNNNSDIGSEKEGPLPISPPSSDGNSPIVTSLPEDQASNVPWRPQKTNSTCEFTHTITNYSQKRESGCKKAEYSSTTVDGFGNRWRLIVYVNGNGRASNHHLSLFLQVADADDLPFGWKKAVSYVLTLEHPSGSSLGYAKRNPDKTFKLCPKAIDWGWSQFITSDRIQQEGYISNDSLTVRASVTVKSSSVSIDPADAELYLKCAVEEGNSEAVQVCLSQGASVNCQFKDDLYTPLHTACSSTSNSGALKVLTLLLDEGADGNACNKWKETPLLIAANNGNKAAVEALLDHGADPSLCSEAGWSALTFAAHKGYDDIVVLLIAAGAPVNCRVTEDLSTPLHKSCAGGKAGHLSAVKQLLKAGGDVHALNKWRETPLLTAANHGQAAAVEALLQYGADPCKCTDTGWSPLSIAAYKGHDDVVRILLEDGAPTEEADPTLSALLQAATKGLPDTVDLLLRHGADHTVTTKKGDTALSILVEQNLIDAAVEMVTEYKASVPRCSRDRKKVQRARLLINLQLKKQQREGKNGGSEGAGDSDDSENDDSSDSQSTPLHDDGSEMHRSNEKKKKKRGTNNGPSAEEIAAAAEAALLEQLEQEEVRKEQEQAASSKKALKKKKKKERERMIKLQEEKEKMEREKIELQAKERLRMQKVKEEKAKRERERQEREALEQAEREQEMIREKAKKAKEEAIRKQRENERKERARKEEAERKIKASKNATPKAAASSPTKSTSGVVATSRGGAKPSSVTPTHTPGNKKLDAKTKGAGTGQRSPNTVSVNSPVPAKRRGWETTPESTNNQTSNASEQQKSNKNKTVRAEPNQRGSQKPEGNIDTHQTSGTTAPFEQPFSPPQPMARLQPRIAHGHQLIHRGVPNDIPLSPVQADLSVQSIEHVSSPTNAQDLDEHVASMATGMVTSFLDSDSPIVSSTTTPVKLSQDQAPSITQGRFGGGSLSHLPTMEHPYVAAYRQERLKTLLQSCERACGPGMLGKDSLGIIFYRWILRAAHGSTSSLDSVIPSWSDSNELVTFFQRQLIAESRKYTDHGGVINIEYLRETGSSIAEQCLETAKEVLQCQEKVKEQMVEGWTDVTIGMNQTSFYDARGESVIGIDWQGRCSVQLSRALYTSLERRYRGPPQRTLTSIFLVVKRYETQHMLATKNTSEKHLSAITMSCLQKDLQTSVEGYSDPFNAPVNTVFCGVFPDVDVFFGGLGPLGTERSGGYTSFEEGRSMSLIMPNENTVASQYLHFLIDMLEELDPMVPLSFAVFIPSESFHDLKGAPKYSDLPLLDARLGGRQGVYVKTVEELPPGKHCFVQGGLDQVLTPSNTGSLFLLLQNEGGARRHPFSDVALLSLLGSMRPGYESRPNYQSTLSAGSFNVSTPTVLSSHHHDNSSTFATIGTPVQTSRSFSVFETISPTPTSPLASNAFGTYSGGVLSAQHSGGGNMSRRVRLFELEDDGDGTENDHSVDVVSGMLSNLGVDIFENTSGQEIDIEAISLLGLRNKDGEGGGDGIHPANNGKGVYRNGTGTPI